jgi:hypothetical protein
VIRTLGYFLVGSLAGLALLAGTFYARHGDDTRAAQFGALCVAVAGIICIIPTLISMALTLWSRGRSAPEQLMAVMGGMGLRMGLVLMVSLPVFLKVPQFRETRERELEFWAAVLICYMGTLAWETFLAARQKGAARDTGRAGE